MARSRSHCRCRSPRDPDPRFASCRIRRFQRECCRRSGRRPRRRRARSRAERTHRRESGGTLRLAKEISRIYSLEVELAGFAAYHEAHIAINVQGTLERTVVLRVGAIAESVSVQAEQASTSNEAESPAGS